MPTRWKYTLIFEGRGHGWTETFYFENGSDDFNAARTQVTNIPDKRAPLLGKECFIKGDRLARVINAAGVKEKRRVDVKRMFLVGNQSQSADQTNMSLLTRWTTGDLAFNRLVFMGGVYDACLPAPDVFTPAGNWTTNFNAWVAACQQANLGWLTSGRTVPATIDGYTFDPDTGHTTYSLLAPGLVWPNGLGKPNKVGVEFPLSKSPLDGTQIVVPLSATSAVTAKPRPAKPFTIQGLMVLFEPTFKTVGTAGGGQALGTIKEQVGASRKRGRPLLESRGRQPVRPLW